MKIWRSKEKEIMMNPYTDEKEETMAIYGSVNTDRRGCPFSGQQCSKYCELFDDECCFKEIMKTGNELLSALYDVLNEVEEIRKHIRKQKGE